MFETLPSKLQCAVTSLGQPTLGITMNKMNNNDNTN